MDLKDIEKERKNFTVPDSMLNGPHGLDVMSEAMFQANYKVNDNLKIAYSAIGFLSIAAVGLAGALIYVALRNPVRAYGLMTDMDGSVKAKQMVEVKSIPLDEAIIKSELCKFMRTIGTVYKDKNYYAEETKRALAYATPDVKSKLQNFIAQYTDINTALDQGQSVTWNLLEFARIDQQADKYQMRFTLTLLDGSGNTKTSEYVAVFFITRIPVKDEDFMILNPTGLIIKDIVLSRNSVVTGTSTPQQAPATQTSVEGSATQQQPAQVQPVQTQPAQPAQQVKPQQPAQPKATGF